MSLKPRTIYNLICIFNDLSSSLLFVSLSFPVSKTAPFYIRIPEKLRTEESEIQSFNNHEVSIDLRNNCQQDSGDACMDVYEDVDDAEDYEKPNDKMNMIKGRKVSSVRYTTSPTGRFNIASHSIDGTKPALSIKQGQRNHMNDQEIYENTMIQDDIYENP